MVEMLCIRFQLPTNAYTGRWTGELSWAPASSGDLDGVLGSRLWPGPPSLFQAFGGVKQWLEDQSLSTPHPLSNK